MRKKMLDQNTGVLPEEAIQIRDKIFNCSPVNDTNTVKMFREDACNTKGPRNGTEWLHQRSNLVK